MVIMNIFTASVFSFLVISVSAAPFVNLKLGGENGIGSGLILSKVKDFGEKVYESKRNFLNGINEKVSNMLWIPPLPSTTTTYIDSLEFVPTERFNHDPPVNTHEQLIFSSDVKTESYEEPYLAIYARSSFLSPDDLISNGLMSPTEKSRGTVNVSNYFNLFGKTA